MFSVPTFDLLTDAGKQQFIEYVVNLSRKEINSYTPNFNNVTSTITDNLTNVVYQNTPYLDFNTEFPGISGVGQIAWNDTAGTLEFGLKGGNVTMPIGTRSVAMVKHADNTGLAKGKVVYVVGSDGANKNVRYALATSDVTSARTFGVVAETVSGGAKAFITTQGLLENLNTISLTEGAPIWVSPTTAGELTTTKPVAPDHLVLVGWCIRSHATTGVIFVHVVNGFELDELHDVKLTSVQPNDLLQYDSTIPSWKNVATIAPNKITGTAVITTDPRLSDSRTPTAHAITHGPAGSDEITIAPSQVTGTAVITTDARLSDSRIPTGTAGGDLAGTYPNPTLALTGTAGTYTKVTTNSKGLVTSGTVLATADLPSSIVASSFQLTGGTPALNQVLTSDATGVASWEPIPTTVPVTICTSTTRPATPINGQLIYETNTNNMLLYNGGWIVLTKTRRMQTFLSTGQFTPPAGVTYINATMYGGGGSASSSSGNNSSVAFTSGTITAPGGAAGASSSGVTIVNSSAAPANSGGGGTAWGHTVPATYGSTLRFSTHIGQSSTAIVAGGTCTPGVNLTVTIGAGASTGGSGLVTIEWWA